MMDTDIEELGLKYVPMYATNKVEHVNVSIINKTAVCTINNKCKLGYPYYDNYTDAADELERYNICKAEKCEE